MQLQRSLEHAEGASNRTSRVLGGLGSYQNHVSKQGTLVVDYLSEYHEIVTTLLGLLLYILLKWPI